MSTIVTGLVIQSYQSWNTYGNDSYTGMCPAGYGAYCPQPKDPNVKVQFSELNLQLVNITGEDFVYVQKDLISGEYKWKWVTGVGYTCVHPPGWIRFKFMTMDSSGFYMINYTVNNSVHRPFYLTLHADERTDYLVLAFKTDKIEMPNSLPFGSPLYTYNVPGILTKEKLDIMTRYNPATHEVQVWVNNQYGFYITQEEPFNLFGFTSAMYYDYYGGIMSYDENVVLENVEANIEVPITTSGSSILDTLLDVIPFARPITSFLQTFMGMATFQYSTATDTGDWSGEPIIPWWVVIFVIYLPIIVIIAYAIQVLRGN